MTRLFKRLAKSRSGAAAVEFAIIGPFLITAMLGVFQIGLGMQNYNALRAVSAEMARYTLVNYQAGNPVDNTLVRLHGRALAQEPPYNLNTELLEVTVTTVATPRLADTMEKRIALRYRVPTMLSIINFKEVPLGYTRTVVLPDD